MYTIYLIEGHRHKPYVGITSKSPEQRLNRHKQDARSGRETHLQNAIRKYGEENFDVVPLDTASSREEALKLERDWISRLGTYEDWGYNCTPGGEAYEGESHPSYGLRHSEEARRKISESQRGSELSDETKEKIRLANKGEKNHSAKLTKQEASEIKFLATSTSLQQKEISNIYGVSRQTVSDIKMGESWRDCSPTKPNLL
jgi:group I intron endonuclease